MNAELANELKRLWPYVKPHRKHMAIAVACMVLSGLLNGAFLWAAKRVLTSMVEYALPAGERLARLNIEVLVLIAILLTRVVIDFGDAYLANRVAQRVLSEIRLDIFKHIQGLSIGFFERKRTGELMSRMTNDLGRLQTLMTSSVEAVVQSPIAIIISIGAMFMLNWRLSLFVFFVLPPVVFMVSRAGRKIHSAINLQQKQLAELTSYLQEKVSAMRLIQTFGTKPYEVAQFQGINYEAYKRTMKPIVIQATLAPLVDFVAYAGAVGALWFGARTIRSAADVSALIVFMIAMNQASKQVKVLAGLNLNLKGAQAAAQRLFEIFDTQPEVRDEPGAIDLSTRKVEGHLVFDDVRFTYPNAEGEVLHGISFSIKPGEVVALAGLSGSGKTTISNLVPRLYDPTKGRITLDGMDLRAVSLLSLRSHIGAVPQETTLFHGTIRDNIAYGKPDATFEEILEAARRANADDFIREQPEGYDTPIGERGLRLSGGQRQRIAIARALLRDPKILILDEATSALDAESESLVQDALNTLMKGRTTLIIAHRFSTIRNANRILVLDKGDIAEVGSHDELLARGGIYARLYQMQTFANRAEQNQEDEVEEAEVSEVFELEDELDLAPRSRRASRAI